MARESGYLTLSPAEMLEPAFYISPLIGEARLSAMIKYFTDQHMNFLTMNTIHFNFLPVVYKLAQAVGVKPPLWRFAPPLRRAARLLGANV